MAWTAVLTAWLALMGWSFMLGGRLSAVEAQAAATDRRLEEAQRDANTVREYMRSIDQRLARIEGKLERK